MPDSSIIFVTATPAAPRPTTSTRRSSSCFPTIFNALKIVGKQLEDLRVLVVGLGAAGVAVTKMMLESGMTHVIGCDRQGALSTEREDYESGEMSEIKRWYAENSNPEKLKGGPGD